MRGPGSSPPAVPRFHLLTDLQVAAGGVPMCRVTVSVGLGGVWLSYAFVYVNVLVSGVLPLLVIVRRTR